MPTNVHSRFVAWFRSAVPWFNAFRGKIFVIAFAGEVVADGKFGVLTRDINLLRSIQRRMRLGASSPRVLTLYTFSTGRTATIPPPGDFVWAASNMAATMDSTLSCST